MGNSVRRIIPALAISLALAAACGGRARQQPNAFPSRELLTREQISRTHAVTAYDAIERLRSQWLRQRGTTQLPPAAGSTQFEEPQIQVYLDNQRMGTLENLRRIEIAAVQYIQFIPPAEASARWGFGHGAGVIYVSTRPM